MGDFIPTKGSLLKRKPEEAFEVVTFNSYKSKKAKTKKTSDEETTNSQESEDSSGHGKAFNIKQSKYEIIKFGTSGFDAKKKQDAKVQLAVRLGAKPPKNKYKNYKELQQERKEEKRKLAEDLDFQELGKNKIGKAVTKTNAFKKKKSEGGIIDVYGTVKTKKVKLKNK